MARPAMRVRSCRGASSRRTAISCRSGAMPSTIAFVWISSARSAGRARRRPSSRAACAWMRGRSFVAMARLPRLHLPGAWYFLTLRSHQDRNLFPQAPQRWLFEQTMAEAAAQTHIHVHGFCFLDTRVRLLVQITNLPTHTFLQLVSSRYSRAVRDSTARSGRLFRERQDVLLFDGDRHLLDL